SGTAGRSSSGPAAPFSARPYRFADGAGRAPPRQPRGLPPRRTRPDMALPLLRRSAMRKWTPRAGERGVTLVELATLLAVLAIGAGLAAPVARVLPAYRATGAARDLYGALHLTRARARTTGVMHALVIERDGRTVRIVEDPQGAGATVIGPWRLTEGVVAS